MRIVVGVIVLLLAHHATAEACKTKGKVLFRMEQSALPGITSVPHAELQIRESGRWSWVQEMPDGQEPASRGGCLSAAHLKELKRTLGKAKFKLVTGLGHCKAIPTMELVYASPKRKKSVTFSAPCSDQPDEWTMNLGACADLATTSSKPSKATIRATCRGLELPER